jgi:hypothetical protein
MNTQTQTSYFVLSFISFLFITWFYFRFKASSKDTLTDLAAYNKQTTQFTIIYYVILIVTQICIGFSVVASNGCDITQNNLVMTIILYTLIPWVFIFGILVLIIMLNSDYKSAFSNVYGYFWVNSSATKILTNLLKNSKDIAVVTAQAANTNITSMDIQNTTDALLKICGNPFVLINEMTPSNFINYMNMLKPLIDAEKISSSVTGGPIQVDANDKKTITDYGKFFTDTTSPFFKSNNNIFYQLYDVVSTRDSIGLFSWYIYTAILTISIANYNIASIPCE